VLSDPESAPGWEWGEIQLVDDTGNVGNNDKICAISTAFAAQVVAKSKYLAYILYRHFLN
jgi:hypothetical protein